MTTAEEESYFCILPSLQGGENEEVREGGGEGGGRGGGREGREEG